jgi:hypothetical protein
MVWVRGRTRRGWCGQHVEAILFGVRRRKSRTNGIGIYADRTEASERASDIERLTAGFCTRTWPSWARFDKRFGLSGSSGVGGVE